jgi:ribonuclease HIII
MNYRDKQYEVIKVNTEEFNSIMEQAKKDGLMMMCSSYDKINKLGCKTGNNLKTIVLDEFDNGKV